ncbi:MAG: hypothetical protein OEW45_18680, partial [Deltaproteobacteria bacterium]|nr:hypothetical protein [Deltaproteobacteria bacterium]
MCFVFRAGTIIATFAPGFQGSNRRRPVLSENFLKKFHAAAKGIEANTRGKRIRWKPGIHPLLQVGRADGHAEG